MLYGEAVLDITSVSILGLLRRISPSGPRGSRGLTRCQWANTRLFLRTRGAPTFQPKFLYDRRLDRPSRALSIHFTFRLLTMNHGILLTGTQDRRTAMLDLLFFNQHYNFIRNVRARSRRTAVNRNRTIRHQLILNNELKRARRHLRRDQIGPFLDTDDYYNSFPNLTIGYLVRQHLTITRANSRLVDLNLNNDGHILLNRLHTSINNGTFR